jgi:hypothetical protein
LIFPDTIYELFAHPHNPGVWVARSLGVDEPPFLLHIVNLGQKPLYKSVIAMSLNMQLKLLAIDEDERIRLEHRYKYLSLNYQIMKLRMDGKNPSEDLMNHAIETGRLANIPEEELCNL